MKKILSVVALMGVCSFASAAAPAAFTPGTATTKNAVATTLTYTVPVAVASRLFVKNNFDFTVSANVLVNAVEDPAGRFMVVGATNTSGRNVYTGSSDGGSVAGCKDPLTAEAAKEADAMATALSGRLLVTGPSGCNPA